MFRRGTWQWEAITNGGQIVNRARGYTVAEALSDGLQRFWVHPTAPTTRLAVRRSGATSSHYLGLTHERRRIVIHPMSSVSDLVFTRRTLMLGAQVGEEIFVRYTWLPNGTRVVIHIQPGLIVIDAE